MTEEDFIFERSIAADLISQLGLKINGLAYISECLLLVEGDI